MKCESIILSGLIKGKWQTEKIYAICFTDKVLILLLHKGLWKNRGGNDNLIEKSAKDMDTLQKRKWKWPLNIWKDTQHHIIRDRLIKTSLKYYFSLMFIKHLKVRQYILLVRLQRNRHPSTLRVVMQNRSIMERNLS